MALFSLLAVLAWIRWDGTRRVGWLAASGSAYLLAALSKETAMFLPLLLLLTPGYRGALATHRIAGVAAMFIGGAMLFAMRSQVGALMPTTFDSHYGLVRPRPVAAQYRKLRRQGYPERNRHARCCWPSRVAAAASYGQTLEHAGAW